MKGRMIKCDKKEDRSVTRLENEKDNEKKKKSQMKDGLNYQT